MVYSKPISDFNDLHAMSEDNTVEVTLETPNEAPAAPQEPTEASQEAEPKEETVPEVAEEPKAE